MQITLFPIIKNKKVTFYENPNLLTKVDKNPNLLTKVERFFILQGLNII
jgi:hypothetical protein